MELLETLQVIKEEQEADLAFESEVWVDTCGCRFKGDWITRRCKKHVGKRKNWKRVPHTWIDPELDLDRKDLP